MKIELNFAGDAIAIPAAVTDCLGKLSNADMRVLLALCADRSLRGEQESVCASLAVSLGISEEEASASISSLRTLGLLSGGARAVRAPAMKKAVKAEEKSEEKAEEKAPEPQKEKTAMPTGIPEYTGEQIAALVAGNPIYKTLVDQTQKILGSIFTPAEVSKVVGLADYLKLEFEHILLIFQYCADKGKKSVQYAVKTAYSLYNEGIDTLEAFEEYLAASAKLDDMAGRVRKIFGIYERSLTAKEKEYIADWANRSIPDELIERAYQITVDRKGAINFPYTNKILITWSDAGYKTVEEVERDMDKYKRDKKSAESSFDTNEFFEAALRRGRERMGGN